MGEFVVDSSKFSPRSNKLKSVEPAQLQKSSLFFAFLNNGQHGQASIYNNASCHRIGKEIEVQESSMFNIQIYSRYLKHERCDAYAMQ